jgi:dTDP-4-dehydrorhamnose reductase
MKILILGGTGMAGHVITIYFKEADHNVTVFSRGKFEHCKNNNGDITV